MRPFFILCIFLGYLGSLLSYPYSDSGAPVLTLGHSLDDLKYLLENQQEELYRLQEKISNQEATIEDLHSRLVEFGLELKKHRSYENELKALSKDSSKDIHLFKQKEKKFYELFLELDKKINQEIKNRENLQEAIQTIMEALEVNIKEGESSAKEAKIYRVQQGDSLEKIAKMHKTSVSSLKEMNRLSNDKIIIGQKLKIP